MIIFIKDRPIRILTQKEALLEAETEASDAVVDMRLTPLKVAHLQGHVVLLNATSTTFQKLITFLNNSNLPELQSVMLITKNKKLIEEKINSIFTIVKAAGGIVVKDQKILLMFRRGVWDLPKGKLDNDEKSKKAALRELKEETGVKAELVEKICTTWHSYSENDKQILKKTKWYLMKCIDDSKASPQAEEGIEKLEWFTNKQAMITLKNSYSSIRYVFEQYLSRDGAARAVVSRES